MFFFSIRTTTIRGSVQNGGYGQSNIIDVREPVVRNIIAFGYGKVKNNQKQQGLNEHNSVRADNLHNLPIMVPFKTGRGFRTEPYGVSINARIMAKARTMVLQRVSSPDMQSLKTS